MSVFAISFGHAKATILSDSLAYLPDRQEVKPLGFTDKVLHLPAIQSLVFSRGMMQITLRVVIELLTNPGVRSIEDAARMAPDLLFQTTYDYADRQGFDASKVAVCEFVLLGWSKTERRMRFWQFLCSSEYEGQDDGGVNYGTFSFPRLPAKFMPALPPNPNIKQLQKIIHAAGRYFVAESAANGGIRVGGEIVAHTVTADAMSSRVVHRFPNYDQVLTAASAVSARIERGDMDVSSVVADGLVPLADCVDSRRRTPDAA